MSGERPSGRRPLIAHVVHRFDVGGMENGIVKLINGLPEALADHCVVALTTASPGFVRRIVRPGVEIHALDKPPGPLIRFLPAVHRLLRRIRPDAVHTRNVGTLECQLAAWYARVPVRIHGEHGWDVGDLSGENRRLLRLRKLMRHFVHHQIALSTPTQRYLVEKVGVPSRSVTNICNGVDVDVFTPRNAADAHDRRLAEGRPSTWPAGAFVVGAIGRLAEVKNPRLLVDAFAVVKSRNADFAGRARLALVGGGPLEADIAAMVQRLGLQAHVWLAGSRDDIPECLRALDLLCLPSLAEGISNTILEAMATGLPVIATDVGGNRELIDDGHTGWITPSNDVEALADRIERCFDDPDAARRMGAAARGAAVTQFSLSTMIDRYHEIYAAQFIRARIHPTTD